MKAVFMYHAIGRDSDIVGADPHYAVTTEHFELHLDIIQPARTLASTVLDELLDSHIVTFDDGHVSNFENALPLLIDKGLLAEFYINTSVIGKKGFINWQHAREMNDAGMSIQSHADSHTYMSDLDESGIRYELERSKKLIEDNLGSEVTVFAPPGGRFDSRVERIAYELGYQSLAVSQPGHMKKAKQAVVPRYAVLHNTTPTQIRELLLPNSLTARKLVAKYHVTGLGKRVLGNSIYDRVRERLLGSN